MEKEAINEAIKKLTGISGCFCSDLNAMHEAEQVLTEQQATDYADRLLHMASGQEPVWLFAIAHATAAQRAESFLKTLGRWEASE